MKRSSRLLCLLALLAAPLLLGAGPLVLPGPAELRQDTAGRAVDTLPAGTPLLVHSAACEQGTAWLDASARGQVGWIAANQVDFAEGVPIAPRPWSDYFEVRAAPDGPVVAALPASARVLATGVGCSGFRAWLKVSAGEMAGWVASQSVLFQPPSSGPPPSWFAAPRPAAAPTPPPYRTASPEYGMHIFAWGRPELPAILQRVVDLRFGWQKSLLRWRDVEAAGKGRYNWSATDALVQASNRAGLKVLLRVDFQPDWARADGANNGPPDNYQDYADFLAALVSRYRAGSPYGQIHAVEVWNEPNLSKTWGDQPINRRQAADYVRLLALTYRAVKAADPSVAVITASLSSTGTNTSRARPDDLYLQWLYDAGLRGHYDALGVHAPGYKAPPELSPVLAAADPFWGGDRSFTFRRVEDLRAVMVRNGDADRQIWVTEFGWTSDQLHPDYSWSRVSEETKGEYLVRALAWARQRWTPWIGPMFVWTLPDPTWGPQDEKYWWAIAEPDLTPRPSYLALLHARQDGTLP